MYAFLIPAVLFVIVFIFYWLIGRHFEGIGQKFEAKEYTGYFRGEVKGAETNQQVKSAVLKIERERGLYFLKAIYLSDESGAYKGYHASSLDMLEDNSIYVTQPTVLDFAGTAWAIRITDKKAINFKPNAIESL